MRDEVSAITRNLAMTVQARTFGRAASVPTPHQTLAEWLSLLRTLFAQFVRNANAVIEKPHFTLAQVTQSADVSRARYVDARALDRGLRRAIYRAGGYIPNTDRLLPARVPEVLRKITFDNAENRYFKCLLLETARNLQAVMHANVSGDEDADLSAEEKFFAALKPEAGVMLRQVQRILRASFLRDIPATLTKPNCSPVLNGHPNYAAFIKVARQLNGGLALRGGIFQIGVKNIALLYEYWCFLRLLRILSDDLHLEQQSIVQLRHLKIVVVLAKGREATVRFRDPVSGKTAYVVYDRLFKGLPTLTQRPDNVIQLASEDRLFILDAKYRLAYDAEYVRKYGGVGPTADDINTMHRYRDAIVRQHPAQPDSYVRGIVRGAVVLFPGTEDDQYMRHQFYRSLASVQIGALPFLPNNTALVREHVRELLKAEGYLGG